MLYVAMTAPASTASLLLGVLYVLGLALLAVGVLGFASEVVVAIHGRLPGTESAVTNSRPVPPTTPSRPLLAPAVPVPADQPLARVLVPTSVDMHYLASFFEGHTDAEGKRSIAGYRGKWIPVDGTVTNVQVFSTSAVVSVYFERKSHPLRLYVPLHFDEPWVERVGLLRTGERIRAVGQIADVSEYEVTLNACELVG